MRTAIHLAQEMGKGVGGSEILQRPLPERGEAMKVWNF